MRPSLRSANWNQIERVGSTRVEICSPESLDILLHNEMGISPHSSPVRAVVLVYCGIQRDSSLRSE
jgi:hypothetical protein